MSNKQISPVKAWGVFIILALVWGSSFILMKKALISFSYSDIGMIRIALAFWFTALVAFRRFGRLAKKDIWPLVIVGVFGNGIPYTLFPLAVTKIDSSLAGILNSLMPLFTLIIGLIWFKIKVKLPGIIGITLGFLGAAWLMIPGLEIDQTKLIYSLYPVIATISYAISVNTINSRLPELDSLSITLLSLMFIGIPATVYVLFFSGFGEAMQNSPQAWESLGYVMLLGIAGSSVAVILFNYLIKKTTSLFAASVTYVMPVVALLWGVADGETVGLEHVFGMLLILAGVYLVNLKGSPADRIRKRKAARAEAERLKKQSA